MRRADIVIGSLGFVVGAAFVYLSLQLPLIGNRGVPGPGMFPLIVAVAIGLSGTLIVIHRLARPELDYGDAPVLERARFLRVATLVAIVAGYFAAFASLGFVLASVLLMGVVILGFERQFGWAGCIAVVAIPAAMYFVFVMVFQLRLPGGILG